MTTLAPLDKARLPWHISYTSPSLAGTLAAVKAGLGITVLPANMIPLGLHAIRSNKLPELVDAEIALFKRAELPKAAEMLAEYITNHLETNAQ
jgi:DNA-binding transcriptional LysR family regulator